MTDATLVTAVKEISAIYARNERFDDL